MLAFNQLGNLGRLGNQMFEYAALRGIAAKHGYDWCIPPYIMHRVLRTIVCTIVSRWRM